MKNNVKTITVTKGSFKTTSVINHVLTESRKEDEHRNKNIDKSRTPNNIQLRVGDLREAIDESFGDAVSHYNTKQNDKRRKINKMSTRVFNNSNAKPVHGFIFAFGSASDLNATGVYNSDNIDVDGDEWNARVSALIDFDSKLDELLNHFNVYTSVLHVDEDNPHLHVFVVPVADTPDKPMSKSFNFNKAMVQSAIQCDVVLETTKTGDVSLLDTMKKFIQGKLVYEMKESYERVNNTTITLENKTKHSKLHIEEYKKAIKPINDLGVLLVDSISEFVRVQNEMMKLIIDVNDETHKKAVELLNEIDIESLVSEIKDCISEDGLDDVVSIDFDGISNLYSI